MLLRILAGLLMMSLAACATTIDNKNELSSVEFVLFQTTKLEVSEHLGLPSKISKQEEEQKEYWYYTDGAKLSGVIVPMLSSPTGTQSISTGKPTSDLDYAAMFVFDKNDILIEVSK